jgi:hypothetical protein
VSVDRPPERACRDPRLLVVVTEAEAGDGDDSDSDGSDGGSDDGAGDAPVDNLKGSASGDDSDYGSADSDDSDGSDSDYRDGDCGSSDGDSDDDDDRRDGRSSSDDSDGIAGSLPASASASASAAGSPARGSSDTSLYGDDVIDCTPYDTASTSRGDRDVASVLPPGDAAGDDGVGGPASASAAAGGSGSSDTSLYGDDVVDCTPYDDAGASDDDGINSSPALNAVAAPPSAPLAVAPARETGVKIPVRQALPVEATSLTHEGLVRLALRLARVSPSARSSGAGLSTFANAAATQRRLQFKAVDSTRPLKRPRVETEPRLGRPVGELSPSVSFISPVQFIATQRTRPQL